MSKICQILGKTKPEHTKNEKQTRQYEKYFMDSS